MGREKAAQAIRLEGVMQAFDYRAVVQPKVSPRLPKDNVVQIRRVGK
jgi:hypothetical protein